MTTTHGVKLRPFIVPSYAVEDERGTERQAATFHLRELSAETLAQMCDEFRAAVFRRAMKRDPVSGPTARLSEL